MFWGIITLFALVGAGVGLAGERLARAVGAGHWPAPCAALSALVWAVLAWRWLSGGWADWWLPVPLALTTFAVPLLFADLRHLRLPNVLTYAAYPLVVAAVGCAAWHTGWPLAWRAGLGGLVFGGAHAVVHLLRPEALGAGDVKLAGSLGVVLGAVGWAALLIGACVAAVITVALSLPAALPEDWTGGRFRRWRSGVPHGPGLLAATWLVAVFPGTGLP